MGAYVSKFGDWIKAGHVMQKLSVSLCPAFKGKLLEDGDMVLERLQGHVYAQDLGWAPNAEHTVALKGGDSTVYVETGYLVDGFEVRKVKAPADGITVFVGASAWKTHGPSGEKMSDLMIWLEYGTDKMPARPLIRPTVEEVQGLIKAGWDDLLKSMVDGEV